MPVSGHQIPRPQRQRPDTMGCAVEASPKRLRHHLRRPDADEGPLIMKPPLTPLTGQTRSALKETSGLPVHERGPSVENTRDFVRLNGDPLRLIYAPAKITESCSKSGETTTLLMPFFGIAKSYFPVFCPTGAISIALFRTADNSG